MRAAACLIFVVVMFAACLSAETPGGIAGVVRDSANHALPGADVLVQSETSGARWRAETDAQGLYAVAGLPPGRYKVTVRMPGFRTASRVGAVVDASASMNLDFAMELLVVHETITVVSDRDSLNPSSGSSLLVTRASPGAALPANGGDYRVLFDLLPGVVITPAGSGDAGQFTSNGQRPNSNTFRVDGVSTNTGVGSNTLPGSFPGASLPAMTAIGSTENLVSNQTTQSVELRTSEFAPEFGERPGSQALVSTRSGTNGHHAEFFGRMRNQDWNARDWFANSRSLAFPRPSYRSLGGVDGGSLRRDRTFFFVSGERSDLTDTGVQLTSVPSMEARLNAPDKLKQILNYYQWPTGPELGDGQAEGLVAMNTSATLYSFSLRMDHALGKWGNLFARAVESPSTSDGNSFNWASLTVGLTAGRSERGIHDLRFNYSRADHRSNFGGGPGYIYAVFGVAGLLPGFEIRSDGAILFSMNMAGLTSLLPDNGPAQTILGLSVPGLGQFISYGGGKARQDQWELRDSFSTNFGRHQLRTGIGYIRLEPSRDVPTYAVLGSVSSLDSLLRGDPLAVTCSSPAQYGGRIHMVNLFAQDTFRLSEKLSLVYGARWEVTPPAAVSTQVPTVSGLWTGTDWQTVHTSVVNGTAPWPMRYTQIAPRLGLAYRLRGSDVILRAGGGTFHDATMGASVNPINGAPFNSWQMSAGGTGVDASGGGSGNGTSQSSTSPDVQKFLAGEYPTLHLPISYQWRTSLEKGFGARGIASAAYLGSAGRHLLGHQAYVDPSTGTLDRLVTLSVNSSNYHAMQLRYSGAATRNVYVSTSYTWSHSIDDGSQDSSIFLIHPNYRVSEARASSNFDIRHALTAAFSYRVPYTVARLRLPPWIAGWTLSSTFRARTGFPIDIRNNAQSLGQGFDNVGRPNLILGQPIWLPDATAAGHSRLNRAAFGQPASGTYGSLGRNAIAGYGLAQLDMSIRRPIPVFRRLSAEVAVSVFNVLNHPSFADPVPYLASPWFGRSTSMQNLMLGTGTPNTGLPPLFQTGGARSAEFSFRVSF